MPKIKTHKGAAKRFKATKSGALKRAAVNRRHKLTEKGSRRKRDLRKTAYAEGTTEKNLRKLLPYS